MYFFEESQPVEQPTGVKSLGGDFSLDGRNGSVKEIDVLAQLGSIKRDQGKPGK